MALEGRARVAGPAARGSVYEQEAAMSKLLVIVGSTRPTRSSDLVMPWLTEQVSEHTAFDAEIVDLRDWPLPIFAEHFGTLGDINDPTYSEPLVKAWNEKIKSADAYVIVTPEYNHSVPGGLKNAIDTVWVSFGFRNKPVAFVSYSGAQTGGVRAIEHLAHIFVEAEAAPIRNSVIIPFVREAFDEAGQPKNPVVNVAAGIMLDDLAWWSGALEKARAAGELTPGSFRMMAALTPAS
jgi:NAD(P)H-dependent FMN reductase